MALNRARTWTGQGNHLGALTSNPLRFLCTLPAQKRLGACRLGLDHPKSRISRALCPNRAYQHQAEVGRFLIYRGQLAIRDWAPALSHPSRVQIINSLIPPRVALTRQAAWLNPGLRLCCPSRATIDTSTCAVPTSPEGMDNQPAFLTELCSEAVEIPS